MPYYKAILKGGHVGAGKEIDFPKFFTAIDIFHAQKKVGNSPRIKGRGEGTGILEVSEISREEYLMGRRKAEKTPSQTILISKGKHTYGHGIQAQSHQGSRGRDCNRR